MLQDIGEFIGWIVLIGVIICLAVGVASLPFAFLGWVMLSAASVFTTVSITYISSAVVGLAVAILATLMSS